MRSRWRGFLLGAGDDVDGLALLPESSARGSARRDLEVPVELPLVMPSAFANGSTATARGRHSPWRRARPSPMLGGQALARRRADFGGRLDTTPYGAYGGQLNQYVSVCSRPKKNAARRPPFSYREGLLLLWPSLSARLRPSVRRPSSPAPSSWRLPALAPAFLEGDQLDFEDQRLVRAILAPAPARRRPASTGCRTVLAPVVISCTPSVQPGIRWPSGR